MKHRFFYSPSFSAYGGSASVAGLYDYGPMGCSLKSNFISLWRTHFIIEENMLEVDCTMLTPHIVLKASGHVDKFSDLMVQDLETKEYYRADHLLKEKLKSLLKNKNITEDEKKEILNSLSTLDAWSSDCKILGEKLKQHNVKAPETENNISEPITFNLMFESSIGPTGNIKGYLRPETAQGIFVNFKKLLDFNQKKMPLACAQIGKLKVSDCLVLIEGTSFRNEISPRQGLLRLREFQMAEIEYFLNPKNKSHPKFKSVEHLELPLLSGSQQEKGLSVEVVSLKEAVKNGLINNETLGYFIGRIYLFLLRVGCKKEYIRFRQHMKTEMAHYACDCWDAELLMSYGWIECVGCADRSAYDLKMHSEYSGQAFVAYERLETPIFQTVKYISPNKAIIGPLFQKNSLKVIQALECMVEADVELVERKILETNRYDLIVDDESYILTSNMLVFKTKEETITEISYVPNVIEPSFGIGRIIYGLLEQNFYLREGSEQRSVISLPAIISPISVSILPLQSSPKFLPYIEILSDNFRKEGLTYKVDDSGVKIGRRYARTDEVGCAFGCTIDFDTLRDNSVTLRERDSMTQIRISILNISSTVRSLVNQQVLWSDLVVMYGLFSMNINELD